MKVESELRDERGQVAGTVVVDTASHGGSEVRVDVYYRSGTATFYVSHSAGRAVAEVLGLALMPPPVRVRVQTADEAAELARGRKVTK